MGFAEAIHTVFTQNYAKFTGRAARSEFWWVYLFYFLVMAVLMVIFTALGGGNLSTDPAAVPTSALLVLVLMGLFLLASVLPIIAVTVRRLHDRNLSGWWYLGAVIASFLPVLGWLAAIAMLVICALPGTEGPNRFGEDPLKH